MAGNTANGIISGKGSTTFVHQNQFAPVYRHNMCIVKTVLNVPYKKEYVLFETTKRKCVLEIFYQYPREQNLLNKLLMQDDDNLPEQN